MLYVFHGSDTPASIKKSHSLIDSLRLKRPDAAFIKIEAGNWTPTIIEEHLGGQGLFSSKYIIFLDRVTENSEAKDSLDGFIPAMQESANIFIVLEGKTNAELTKAFEKFAEKVIICEEKKSAGYPFKRDEFSVFALADALGLRDSFKAWNVYRKALENGLESESILSTLFWQVKSMMVSVATDNVAQSGLKPFVYSKSKRYASNYSRDELSALFQRLLTLYHDGHRGMVNMELGIERLLLDCGK